MQTSNAPLSVKEYKTHLILPNMYENIMQSIANHESSSKPWCPGLLGLL